MRTTLQAVGLIIGCALAFAMYRSLMANAGAVAAYYGWHYVAGLDERRFPFWMPFREAWAPTKPGMIHQAVCWGLVCTATIAFSIVPFHRLRWPWSIFFVVMLLSSVFMCSGYVAALLELWGRPAVFRWCRWAADLYVMVIIASSLIVALAIVRDSWHGLRGDSLHGTGIVLLFVIAVMQLALYYRYFPLGFGSMWFSQYISGVFGR